MAEELIDELGDQLTSITLIKGGKGQFEVTVDGTNVYSKTALGRHAQPGEAVAAVAALLSKR